MTLDQVLDAALVLSTGISGAVGAILQLRTHAVVKSRQEGADAASGPPEGADPPPDVL